jgi:hypothetical protein
MSIITLKIPLGVSKGHLETSVLSISQPDKAPGNGEMTYLGSPESDTVESHRLLACEARRIHFCPHKAAAMTLEEALERDEGPRRGALHTRLRVGG